MKKKWNVFRWGSSSLTRRVGFGLAVLFVLMLIAIGGVFYQVQQQSADSVVVNISGRQRMLSQKITRLALEVEGGNLEAAADLASMANLFDTSLNALQYGDPEQGIPPASEGVSTQLDVVREIWLSFHESVQVVIDSAETGGSATEAVSTIVGLSDELLSEANKAVTLFDQEAQAKITALQFFLGIIGLLFLALMLVFSRVVQSSILKPMKRTMEHLNVMASGDFTGEIDAGLAEREDEIGDLARASDSLKLSTKDILAEMIDGTHTLSSAATELMTISQETNSNVVETQSKINTVSSSSNEMKEDSVSAASRMEQASMNLNSVSVAVEEMSATIGDIALNSERAHNTTAETTRQTDLFASIMRGLGDSAQEISKVTETISSISAQTNLLALNATIEAARAGSAGKGFAVVANEIKELAQETATATDEIKSKIGGIQNATIDAVKDLEGIVDVIKEVNEIVISISAAIQEQSTVTKDVAVNISQASSEMKDANEKVGQTATSTTFIADAVSEVESSTKQISSGSEQVQESATELSRLSEQLKQLTSRFKV